MPVRPRIFDDLAGVAGGALSAFAGLREELEAMVRGRVDETLRRLDLVPGKRHDFSAVGRVAGRRGGGVRVAGLAPGVVRICVHRTGRYAGLGGPFG